MGAKKSNKIQILSENNENTLTLQRDNNQLPKERGYNILFFVLCSFVVGISLGFLVFRFFKKPNCPTSIVTSTPNPHLYCPLKTSTPINCPVLTQCPIPTIGPIPTACPLPNCPVPTQCPIPTPGPVPTPCPVRICTPGPVPNCPVPTQCPIPTPGPVPTPCPVRTCTPCPVSNCSVPTPCPVRTCTPGPVPTPCPIRTCTPCPTCEPTPYTFYQITLPLKSNKCVDYGDCWNDSNFGAWPCDSQNNSQKFKFQYLSSPTGAFKIVNGAGLCLDAKDTIWNFAPCSNSSTTQLFGWKKLTTNNYRYIENLNSNGTGTNICLDTGNSNHKGGCDNLNQHQSTNIMIWS